MWFLHTPLNWDGLASSLGGQLLARSLPPRGFVGRFPCLGHSVEYYDDSTYSQLQYKADSRGGGRSLAMGGNEQNYWFLCKKGTMTSCFSLANNKRQDFKE